MRGKWGRGRGRSRGRGRESAYVLFGGQSVLGPADGDVNFGHGRDLGAVDNGFALDDADGADLLVQLLRVGGAKYNEYNPNRYNTQRVQNITSSR